MTPFGMAPIMRFMANKSRSNDKAKLRACALAQRDALDLDQIEIGAQAILERVLGLAEYQRATVIHTYVSSKENEVDTRELIHISLEQGKQVVVPVVERGVETMGHAVLVGMDELVNGPMGLVQPNPRMATWLDDAGAIDMVVVPGVAFDRRGHRIGFGGGFYDRFLATVSCAKVGLCYDALVLGAIPDEVHDVAMDIVVAESAVYKGE